MVGPPAWISACRANCTPGGEGRRSPCLSPPCPSCWTGPVPATALIWSVPLSRWCSGSVVELEVTGAAGLNRAVGSTTERNGHRRRCLPPWGRDVEVAIPNWRHESLHRAEGDSTPDFAQNLAAVSTAETSRTHASLM